MQRQLNANNHFLTESDQISTPLKSHRLSFNIKSSFLLFIFFIFFINLSFAQKKFSISGYVREKESRELLPGVNIYVPTLKLGAITNNYGFYSLSLQEGEYDVHYSFVGYEPVIQHIKLNANQSVNIDLTGITLEEVVISAERSERVSESSEIGMISLPVQQIKQIPALLGEKDVFKALQLMPGVQKGSEGSSGLYVRGGGPDQNLIILDDAPVYNANHLFGFFSIFNGDALKSVELIKGGFPARFGGRLSSVVEMTMKDGNKQKLAGEAGIGLIASRIVLEGPLKKDVSSFIISGRRTYVDALSRPFMNKDEYGGYYFYDLNAKVNYDLGSNDRLYLSGYFGRDKFKLVTRYRLNDRQEGGLYWQNATATLRWNHQYGPKLFSNTSFIFSRYNMNIFNYIKEDTTSYSLDYLSGIRDFSLKYDLDYFLAPWYNIKTGLSLINHRFSPSAIVEKDDANLVYSNNTTHYESLEGGLYLENSLNLTDKFKLNAGVRFSNFFTKGKDYYSIEPRLVMNYKILKDISVKAGYAEMNQYIHLLSNTGLFLPTDLWVPSTSRVEPQHSQQYSAGFAKDFPSTNIILTLEGYYKTSNKVLGYKPGASFMALDDPTEAQNFTWEDNVTAGQGKSYGVEFLLHKKTGKFSGWIGYTLSWTKLQFDELNFGKEFWARYDRRHDIALVGIYQITPTISFSSTWVYGTGNAITLPLGRFKAETHNPFLDALIMAGQPAYFNYFGEMSDYGNMNSYRMKAYHRLDFAFQFTKKKENYERTWEIGAYNTYNRKNPFFYFTDDYYEDNTRISKLKQVSIFPIIPSVTYSIKF